MERVRRIESVALTYALPDVKLEYPVEIYCVMQGAQTWCSVTTLRGGMGWEVGWGGRWEGASRGRGHAYIYG